MDIRFSLCNYMTHLLFFSMLPSVNFLLWFFDYMSYVSLSIYICIYICIVIRDNVAYEGFSVLDYL